MADEPTPGWHPDPTGRYDERFHDGAWTDRVRATGADEESRDPIPDEARPYLPAPAAEPPSEPAAAPRSRRGRIALGVLAVAVAIVVVVALASGGDDTEETVRARDDRPRSSVRSRSTTDTDDGPVRTTTTAAPVREVTIEGQGFTQLPPNSIGTSYVSYGVVLHNPSPDEAATYVSANIAFYDDAGTVVGSESKTVSIVLPGQRAGIGGSADVAGATRMTVQVLARDWEEIEGPTGAFTAEGVTVSVDRFSLTTRGELVSSFAKDLQSIEAVAIYRDEAGAIVGGDATYVDFVPAGGRAAVEVSDFHQVPNVAGAEILASITSLSLLQP